MSEVEDNVASAEDKFFGVKTQHGELSAANNSSEDSEIEVEVTQDAATAPEPETKGVPLVNYSKDLTDEELASYSEGVQKRIGQITRKVKDRERRLAEAQSVKDEAVRVAQVQQKKLQEYEALLAGSQGALIESSKGKAQAELDSAEKELKKAHEEGDADKLVQSQKLLSAAQARIMDYEQREARLKQQLQAQKQRQQAQPETPVAPQQQAPQMSPEQQERMDQWIDNNPWFASQKRRAAAAAEGKRIHPLHKQMTAMTVAIHDELEENGITFDNDPDTYYGTVDKIMRERFPDYEGFEPQQEVQEDRSAPQRQRSNTAVVAPSNTRNNGAKTRKVALTPSQHAVARTLGLTPEQYAAQLIKEAG